MLKQKKIKQKFTKENYGLGIIRNIYFYKTQNRIKKTRDKNLPKELECTGIQRARLDHSICQNLNINY